MKIPKELLGAARLGPGAGLAKRMTPAVVNLPRAMGAWRIVACMSDQVGRRFVDASVAYSLMGDRGIEAVFTWRDKGFSSPVRSHGLRGWVTGHASSGVWKLSLFPLVTVTHIIAEAAADYSWAAVAHPSRKFGWILSRSPFLPEAPFRNAMYRFATFGYDTTKLIRIPQPEPGEVAAISG